MPSAGGRCPFLTGLNVFSRFLDVWPKYTANTRHWYLLELPSASAVEGASAALWPVPLPCGPSQAHGPSLPEDLRAPGWAVFPEEFCFLASSFCTPFVALCLGLLSVPPDHRQRRLFAKLLACSSRECGRCFPTLSF